METKVKEKKQTTTQEIEFSTFYLGELLIGIDIQQVQEINQHLDMTPVPHSPEYVNGVVNLRGEVVTVLDLRIILGLDPIELTERSRNVIVKTEIDQVGLLVDRVADVVIGKSAEIEPAPANIRGVDGRFFSGVYKLENELLVILDVMETIASKEEM